MPNKLLILPSCEDTFFLWLRPSAARPRWELTAYLFGLGAALLVGLSKTGVPGVAIPAVVLMSEAFAGDEKLSVGALLPVLLVGDVFAVGF